MTQHYPVIIIGGGQAGLSMSYCLQEHHVDHIIFEKQFVGYAWQHLRWDSFCLVTPNWQCSLPGYPYPGDDPHGFMVRDEIVQYIKDYAAHFHPPVKEGVTVQRLSQSEHHPNQFALETSIGPFTADQVVIATGGYHRPKIPAIAERFPSDIRQLHALEYKNPHSLPDQPILIVGTGQSGCQIAEDLHLAGKQVHLSVGSAPRSPRQYRGRDVVAWLDELGYYDLTIDQHPDKQNVRHKTNHYLTGRDGGREIDLRQFARDGMQLYGRLRNIQDNHIEFLPNLTQNLDAADEVAASIKRTIDTFITNHQIDAPTDPPYTPVWYPDTDPTTLDYRAANIGTVIWCTGYEADYRWVDIPVFDGNGYPGHERGVTTAQGLYFLGLPWLYTWGSGRFSGIARDAAYLADYITARQRVQTPDQPSGINQVALGS